MLVKHISLSKLIKNITKVTYYYTSVKSKAFSLIEVAIAIVLVGIVTFPLISITTGFLERAKIEKTNKSIFVIKEALVSYFLMNKALPCPADPTLNPNKPSYGSSQSCSSINGTVIGSLPADALGLSRDFILDGYGRKFTYAVPSFLTTSGNVRFYKDRTTKTIIPDDGTLPLSSDKQITLNSSGGTLIASDVFFIINSHGKDGVGAYLENGSRLKTTNINTSVASGMVAYGSPSFTLFSKNDPTGDDVLQYGSFKSISSLLQDYGYIDCQAITTNNSTVLTDISSFTFSRTPANTTITGTALSCPNGTALLQTPTANCSASGDWINFKPQECGYYNKDVIYGTITFGDVGTTSGTVTSTGPILAASKTLDAASGATAIEVSVDNLGGTDYRVQTTLKSNDAKDVNTVSTPVIKIIDNTKFQILLKDIGFATQDPSFGVSLVITSPLKSSNQLDATSYPGMPLCSITALYSTAIPDGWKLCDGANLTTTDICDQNLKTYCGLTATAPDLRGLFLRGFDSRGTEGMDLGLRYNPLDSVAKNSVTKTTKSTAIGSIQDQAIIAHAHSLGAISATATGTATTTVTAPSSSFLNLIGTFDLTKRVTTNTTTSNPFTITFGTTTPSSTAVNLNSLTWTAATSITGITVNVTRPSTVGSPSDLKGTETAAGVLTIETNEVRPKNIAVNYIIRCK
jgi:type II secretory pathway pseudopilin PulG